MDIGRLRSLTIPLGAQWDDAAEEFDVLPSPPPEVPVRQNVEPQPDVVDAHIAALAKKPRLRIKYARDYRVLESVPLVKHWIDQGELACIFGPSNTFNKTVVTDLMCSIAHGIPWMGCETTRGAVLVIELEGEIRVRASRDRLAPATQAGPGRCTDRDGIAGCDPG